MEQTMTKEQVIEATINVLGDISVPVKLEDQISRHINGAIYNLNLVLQMIALENEHQNMNDEESGEEPEEEETDDYSEQTGCPICDSPEG